MRVCDIRRPTFSDSVELVSPEVFACYSSASYRCQVILYQKKKNAAGGLSARNIRKLTVVEGKEREKKVSFFHGTRYPVLYPNGVSYHSLRRAARRRRTLSACAHRSDQAVPGPLFNKKPLSSSRFARPDVCSRSPFSPFIRRSCLSILSLLHLSLSPSPSSVFFRGVLNCWLGGREGGRGKWLLY